MKKRFFRGLAVFLLLCSLFPMGVYATQEKIDRVQQEIKDLEEKKQEAGEEADSLEEKTGSLEGDLEKFNNSLAAVAAELNETEQELKNTRMNLKNTRNELEEAKKREKDQYEAMKKRIRFLYEMDQEGILEVLASSEDFADFLNRTEYIASIQEYDREMLEIYKETKEEIAGKEQELEEQEKTLAQLQEQQEEKSKELAKLVSDTSQELNAAKKQLADAQADVAAYEARLKKQKAYEEELEAQKAAEDAKRLEEIRRQEEENSRKPIISEDASDIAILAALIQCEAGGESYEGKLAVGSVVMNRVRSSHFPDTLAGVIYQSGQFTPVASGRFAAVLAEGANESCFKAARETLGGNITNDCLYFRRNNGSILGMVIGNHVFY